MGITKHDRIAKEIAEKKGVEYHSDKGVDIRTSSQVIEVEVDANKLKESVSQLQGTNKARYLAVPNELVKEAIDYTTDTGVGVMNEHGKIKKRAR
ncbi:MAG: hypothetical protein A2729_01480 [Candidatus Buchananbacteria bacterium RIFCSPHIGHO2_01_FULL_39_14]|uniref:Uncharacterized protein n=2 Tax=Candidatus Buchananiibacteriota TaxID=1817903 RepID=A0A1G1YTY3_9BACT|nr:MAG: hypothetical protein A2729_01480 [Candidatus Buchananbacteria bacterium RIFCSPHIGHO2_01_FULL_39_14]OGY49143.1 MAG: hypothetical protein A3D39_05865 [Candidatus Buchananbacteria bacterium RIFCSPHIGHO2_02_FULL_39_17]OGY55236.1 MAG: hypothetical protein A2912_03975 [Candidatus Buchananbacteria bacterium RIFCSPLOWO2_01_FULL_40_23b]